MPGVIQNMERERTMLCFTFILLLLVISTLPMDVSAGVIFQDDFEYTDSPVNHGWTVTGDGDEVFTSTTEAFSGSRSLRIDHQRSPWEGFTVHDFGARKISGDEVLSISVMFFDEMITGTNFDAGVYPFFDGSGHAPIIFYNPSNYIIRVVSPDNDVFDSISSISRSPGWHQFKWVIENNLLDIYIDGVLQVSDVTTYNALHDIRLAIGTETPLSAYFDNVLVTTTTNVPEPATFALLGFGLAGIGFKRRRQNFG